MHVFPSLFLNSILNVERHPWLDDEYRTKRRACTVDVMPIQLLVRFRIVDVEIEVIGRA